MTEKPAVWQPISSAPKDGTPLLLFGRAKSATAPAIAVGWFLPDDGWIEACYFGNRPVGLVPTHWMHLPERPND